MKILIITESIPYPPSNGKEVPIANIFERIAKQNDVDILVLTGKEIVYNKQEIPSSINDIFTITAKEKSTTQKLLSSLALFKMPSSFYEYNYDEVVEKFKNRHYDFVWLSPTKFYGFIEFCKKNKMIFFTKLAIGLNDSKTFAYRDYLNEILYPSIFNWKYFSFWLRSYIVVFEERTYLKEANLVHVQTKAEAEKIEKIFPGYSDRVIVAPNGIRTELLSCSYKGIDSNYILFMTHHTGGRYRESEWFIKKIWPEIIKKLPHARLLIVGKPSNKKIEYLENAESVIINGFAENLCEVYDKVRLVVLPVFHGTGLINRIQDALVAGTPIISTPQAISTFPEIRENEQIVAAATTTQFIQKVVWLYNNKEKRISLSKASRTFAETMCTWDATVQKIESALKENL